MKRTAFLLFWCNTMAAQNALINVSGKVSGSDQMTLASYVMVVNLKTGQGHFTEADGSFEIAAEKTDTIAFAILGYYNFKVCYRDSLIKSKYFLNVVLKKKQYQLKEVTISGDKTLDEIRSNLSKLGQNTKTIKEHKQSVLSPVTFLYEEFSSRERSKRKLAEMQDADQRRAVLKDFVHLCIKSHLIDLEEEKLDAFMDFFNVTDYFLSNSSDYEILITIKEKYHYFKLDPKNAGTK